jgi:hypothetical protein
MFNPEKEKGRLLQDLTSSTEPLDERYDLLEADILMFSSKDMIAIIYIHSEATAGKMILQGRYDFPGCTPVRN